MSCDSPFKAWRLPWRGGVIAAILLLLGVSMTTRAAQEMATLQPIDARESVKLDFLPPEPGTYELFNIMRAADGDVLDIDGQPRRLDRYTGGKLTLLSFIYSTCADPSGCPYAYMVFHSLKNRIEGNPALRDKVRLVSLSFDPQRDTPEVLKLYAGDHALPGQPVEWNFLTTASIDRLVPILEEFGQDVFIDLDPATGKALGSFSHVLKVFLIDRDHVVREVYTTVYLQPDMLYNDILTLMLEQGEKTQ